MTAIATGSNTLGISAKSIHAGRKALRSAESVERGLVAKTVRYSLKRAAQSRLFRPELEAKAQHRTVWCHRTMSGDFAGVYRQEEGSGARFSGLHTCGSVWACPVCSAKITEQRRRDLDKAVTAWLNTGKGVVQLMTLTFPHEADQSLEWLLERQGKALQSFKNSRTFKRVMSGAGRVGSIRSLEVTHGQNGWHPHTHDLVFLNRDLSLREVDELKRAWVEALYKQGLGDHSKESDMFNHALDMQDGSYAAEYIAKFGHDAAWGVSAEMTKPHAKVGQRGEFGGAAHYTPFQLLAWAADGDQQAAQLFTDFVDQFQGKRMLSWSPKLRKTLNLAELEMSDEDIAAHDEPAPDESRVGQIDGDQLKVLLSRDRMGDFIGYVARCCADPDTAQQDINEYIEAVAKLPKTHGGSYRQRNHFSRGHSTFH